MTPKPRTTVLSRARDALTGRAERLFHALSDGRWHSSAELVQAVGHTFAVAKWVLVHQYGYPIERRYNRTDHTHEYRLAGGVVSKRVPPRHTGRGGRTTRTPTTPTT